MSPRDLAILEALRVCPMTTQRLADRLKLTRADASDVALPLFASGHVDSIRCYGDLVWSLTATGLQALQCAEVEAGRKAIAS